MRPDFRFPMQTLASVLLLTLLFMMSACDSRGKKKHLSQGKMESILYDYHMADAISGMDYDYRDTLRMRVYKQAVLKKHGVSEADFDSSMVYYTRHADQLYKIYERLSKRFADEAIALGTSASEANQYLSISNTGDTANVWTGDPSFVLTHHPGFNVYSFTLTADSTYKPGDRLVLSYDAKFIFQDGMRDAMAVLAVTFENDSTASAMTRMYADNVYKVNISDTEKLGIKQISGYFTLHRNSRNDSQTTLKMLHVGNIALVRMHSDGTSEKVAPEPEQRRKVLDDRGMETMEEPLELELDPAEKENLRHPESIIAN